jgi:hypothetical protein
MKESWGSVEDGFELWCDRHPRYMTLDSIARRHFLIYVWLAVPAGAITGTVIRWLISLL